MDPLTIITLGSLALDSGSRLLKGFGEKSTQDYLAARDERAAEIGRIKADQADVAEREQLNTVLANIDAIRSAAGVDPLSPTGLALREEQTRVSDRQRRTAVANINAQADEDLAASRYRRYAGNMALFGRTLEAGAGIGRRIGQGSY